MAQQQSIPRAPHDHPLVSRSAPGIFVDAVPCAVAPDAVVMNPLRRRTLKQTINFDTRFRNFAPTSNACNFLFDLPVKFSKVVNLELTAMELPPTTYNISAAAENNVLVVGVSDAERQLLTFAPLVVPDGHYSLSTLLATLNGILVTAATTTPSIFGAFANLAFATASPPTGSDPNSTPPNLQTQIVVSHGAVAVLLLNGNQAVASLSQSLVPVPSSASSSAAGLPPTTLLPPTTYYQIPVALYFGVSQGSDLTAPPTPTFAAGTPSAFYSLMPFSLGWMLGFRQEQYALIPVATGSSSTSSTSSTSALSYYQQSECVPDLVYPKYVYLSINDYNHNVPNVFTTCFNASASSGKNILARISAPTAMSASIYSTENRFTGIIGTARDYFGPVDISKLHIQLLDEYGRVLGTNPFDYSFCLQFTMVYDL